jgi:hypothetical protein
LVGGFATATGAARSEALAAIAVKSARRFTEPSCFESLVLFQLKAPEVYRRKP